WSLNGQPDRQGCSPAVQTLVRPPVPSVRDGPLGHSVTSGTSERRQNVLSLGALRFESRLKSMQYLWRWDCLMRAIMRSTEPRSIEPGIVMANELHNLRVALQLNSGGRYGILAAGYGNESSVSEPPHIASHLTERMTATWGS